MDNTMINSITVGLALQTARIASNQQLIAHSVQTLTHCITQTSAIVLVVMGFTKHQKVHAHLTHRIVQLLPIQQVFAQLVWTHLIMMLLKINATALIIQLGSKATTNV